MDELERLLARITNLPLPQLAAEVLAERRRAERATWPNRDYARVDYVRMLGGFLWILDNRTQPGGVAGEQLRPMRGLARVLVDRGDLPAEVLPLFGQD